MEIEMCEEFYYRIDNKNLDILKAFNTNKENVLRNNKDIQFYNGEWVKVKVNNYKTHYVKPAENLTKIALENNTTPEKIFQDNNLDTSKLFIGQMLKIYK